MIRLFGEISLYLALLFAFTQGFLSLLGYIKNNNYVFALARPSAIGQCVFVVIAYLLLTLAFAINDFSIAYVAENSHRTLPLIYRLTAVWGGHEGSILFWILVLNGWTMIFIFSKANNKILTLSLLGMISFGFLFFLLLTSNPFFSKILFSEGQDLTPLLQDPGFLIHPPMLYIGYVGFSLAFVITLAALIHHKLDNTWARTTRHFAIGAWCFLTLGITLGSWWAYRVLGWGGFWFWDPVENASLLPWLSGTALIHVLILCEKRNTCINWATLLAILTFALSLLGTFLVRSGVLISVHTFANDPSRGIFLLLIFAILITAALFIYISRLVKVTAIGLQHPPFTWLSREMALLLNSGLLILAMSTVLLGTLYPLILDALQLGTISVGAPYFNKVMMPLIFILMFAMGLAALLNWQQQSFIPLLKQSLQKMFISCIASIAFLWGVESSIETIAFISLMLSFWIILSVQKSLRFYPGMSLGHIGFAILVIGIMLSSVLNQEREVKVQPGDVTKLGPYLFSFVKIKGMSASNYRGIEAEFAVTKNFRPITTLHPEKRIYTVRDTVITKVDIHPSLFRDLYIALGQPLNGEYWSVRMYYKPFIRWIWFGGFIMMIGGILAITRRIT